MVYLNHNNDRHIVLQNLDLCLVQNDSALALAHNQ